MIIGKKHVHSNFGSGTLRGVPTYYTEHCCAYLNSMSVEFDILKEKGVTPQVFFHPFVKMTTPYDQAYSRLREKSLGHGSCGMGIVGTMKRHLDTGYKLHAIDFKTPAIAKAKLENIKEYYYNLVEKEGMSGADFHDEYSDYEDYFFDQIGKPLFQIASYEKLNEYETLIFEGSQGILLDMDHGFFPNVTYANTTSKNALEICEKLMVDPELWYVTRCYQTRHGNGWMSETGEISLVNADEEINITNKWQGEFRIRELDYDLLNYAMDIDSEYLGIDFNFVQKNLVLTCLDQRPDFIFDPKKLTADIKTIIGCYSPRNDPSVNAFKTIKK
jgi:adenylosuccinate synthase